MNRQTLNTLFASLAATCLGPAAAVAQPVIQGTLSNFDVWNRTGQTANDFHVDLRGINPNLINNLYLGDYPNATIAANQGGTSITWTGSSTANGDFDHFGVRLNGAQNPTGVRMNWTFDGVNIGGISDVAQMWFTDIGVVIDDITNRSSTPFWIQRRINTVVEPEDIELEDLLIGLPIWNSATLIDPDPIWLGPGDTQLYEFQVQNDTAAVVMMYDVFADANGRPGEPVLTFLNAAVIPAPGASALLVCGGILATRRRRT